MSDDPMDAHAAIADAVAAEAQTVSLAAAAVWAQPAPPTLASAVPPAKLAASPKSVAKATPAAKAKAAPKPKPAGKN